MGILKDRARHDVSHPPDRREGGSVEAACIVVQREGRALLRFAYLLTGDDERALQLTLAALIELLTDETNSVDTPGPYLALRVAQRYRREPSRSTWLNDTHGDSYGVDDDRSRMKEALDRLTPDQRMAVVLSEVMQLSEAELRTALDFDSRDAFRTGLTEARRRLASAVGRAPEAPIVDLLNRIAVAAPAIDLWPEIEGQLERAWAARRRSERLLTAAVIAGVVVVLGGALLWISGIRPGWSDGDAREHQEGILAVGEFEEPVAAAASRSDESLASFAAAPTRVVPTQLPVSVADIQLLRFIEQAGSGQSALQLYDAAANTAAPLLEAGGTILVSPDGQWIVADRSLQDAPGRSLIAMGTTNGRMGSQAEIASPRAITMDDERVVVMNRLSSHEFQIEVLALVDGRVIASWPLDNGGFGPSALRAARLHLSRNGERLTLLAEWARSEQDYWVRTITSYDAGSGALIDSIEAHIAVPSDDSARDFSVSSARLLPGSSTLYSAVQDARTAQVRLQFLDLETGELTGIALPIAARVVSLASQRGENEIHLVPSNTGTLLYVIQSRQRRVAVVDLLARRLIGAFPLTAPPDVQATFEGSLNYVSFMEALLSPDGARLYLAANRERNQAINGYPSQSPVWVINTTTWEVEVRWTVTGLPRRMTMNGDGTRLYVRSARADGRVYLTTLDTRSGETLNVWDTLPAPEWADIHRIVSLAQLYHEQHGVRPISGPVRPQDNLNLAVLPGVRVEADGAVAGAESIVTAQIVHPLTGAPASDDGTLRFDPDATVVVELSGISDQAILVPSSVEPGVYRGRVRLDSAGAWDARVTVINLDGTTWTVDQPAAFDVAEGLVASDGGAYRFLVRPGNPVNRRTITLRVWMVESQSRERLPEEIEFLDQIGQEALIILTHPDGEVVETPLTRIDHGSFMGWARFGAAGLWSTKIVVTLGDGERLAIKAGPIEISDLTEPYRRTNSSSSGGGGGASD